MINNTDLAKRLPRNIRDLPEKYRKLLEARRALKDMKSSAGIEVGKAQMEISAAKTAKDREDAKRRYAVARAEVDRLAGALRRNQQAIDVEEDLLMSQVTATFEQHFLSVVRESVPREQFKAWCKIAGDRFSATVIEEPHDERSEE